MHSLQSQTLLQGFLDADLLPGLLTACLVLIVVNSAQASLPPIPEDTRFVIGTAQAIHPLPFDEFYRRLGILLNMRDERLRDGQPNPDRLAVLKRVQRRGRQTPMSGREAAAWAVDWLRLGQLDTAIELLAPRLRDPRPDYFVPVVLGHLYAERGDWRTALRYHLEGVLDAPFPDQIPGLSPIQRDWWEKLDREYVPHYYRLRQQEAEMRLGKSPAELARLLEEEDVLPLFPLPSRERPQPSPVRFVNEQGEYQPGHLAQAERAKLPPDALAIVQQLLFWHPSDTRLLWLLGELYAAQGELDAAFQIFDTCTWGRQYGNRRRLMEHRHVIDLLRQQRPTSTAPEEPVLTGEASATTPPAEQPDASPISMRTVAIYFSLVGLIALLALYRTLKRHR
ncbi:MAG: hypothetical protein NZU63_07760 [Gemmataceae bacterium]|nr:hypothetical protein [Gemmataceae bacterium]MDW8242136.1 hypothetical protein [Thermogemmata sp.]